MTVRRMSQGEMMVWAATFALYHSSVSGTAAVLNMRIEPIQPGTFEEVDKQFTAQMRDP